MPLLQVGNKGNWLHVEDLDGQKHWIFSKLVSAKGSCVAVKVKTATLRQGPGSRRPASELPFAERYSAFRKIDRDDAWVKLEDEYGGRFWIHESTIWIPMMRARISY